MYCSEIIILIKRIDTAWYWLNLQDGENKCPRNKTRVLRSWYGSLAVSKAMSLNNLTSGVTIKKE